LRCEKFDEGFQDFQIRKTELLLFAFPLEAGIQKSAESMQKELINLKGNIIQTITLMKRGFQEEVFCAPDPLRYE